MIRGAIALAALSAALLAGAGGGYWYAMRGHSQPPAAASSATSESGGRKILYWYDPMHPQDRFDKPGKSPFMDMQLVPKYADVSAAADTVSINPRVMQTLGLRLAEAKRGTLAPSFSAVGSVEYNERSVVVVQPRANGFIERLHVRAPLDMVRQGAPLVEMLVPEWAAAQEEYLLLRRRSEPGAADLAAAARQRLVLLGMADDQIRMIERTGVAQPRITLQAPISGVIAELGVRQGMTVTAGATLFRIAGIGTVWVIAEIPEAQSGMFVPGSRVEVRAAAYPNEKFPGSVSAILPEINAATRTLRARIEVTNPGGKLKPGMYTSIDAPARTTQTLLVPSEALIRTGERDVVIVAEHDGRFRAVEVEPGVEAGDQTEIRKGLTGGEQVVVSGQFLIDSEANLRSALKRLEGAQSAATASPGPLVQAERGRIAAVDADKGRVEIAHGPIAALKWPAMTMEFTAADKHALAALKPGDTVEFTLRSEPDSNGDYVIERIRPVK